MPESILLSTEVFVGDGLAEVAIAEWSRLRADTGTMSALFRSTVDNAVLELMPLADLSDLSDQHKIFNGLFTGLAPYLHSDFRRQVLEYVEAPKPFETVVPNTEYVQLRHIEVPPAAYDDYRQWREQTIFDVVRKADDVVAFAAYHSLLSTEPGVMFVSGFDVDPSEYAKIFATDEYREIVRQAGSRYIVSGERGLHTKIYQRVRPA